MLRARVLGLFLLICWLIVSAVANDNAFNCNCDDEGFWSIQFILECQKVSDFLIAVAYFSIPIELLYFVSFSNVPFKWVLVQFIAFIVLCGLTHLLNGWTYYGPHSFQLMLSLTIAKFLTALVSCATAITLLTLIPLLLKWKVRELFLRQNVLELDQEVGMMKKQKEASWHVRMLTREIRKSLDKHTILYTTLVELSKTLDLQNCVVWMPNEKGTEMHLTHELKVGSSKGYQRSIPNNDLDVIEIKKSKGVIILRPDSALAAASSGGPEEPGPVAAIRMPLLQVSNFKGGTPELIDTRYAILVLVLPCIESRDWSGHEKEIVEVVADQVAVALSHAAVLEESQLMREKLGEQNRVLQQARKNAVMASEARNSFQKVMSHGMRRPMHSIMGLLSILQDENTISPDQRLIVDAMAKTSGVLSTLINDVMEISTKDNGKFQLEMRPFQLHSMVREASSLARCLCIYKRFDFLVDVQSSLPDRVMGDEGRTFQVILHMVGYLLDSYNGVGGVVTFRILSASGNNEGVNDRRVWGTSMAAEAVHVKFEIEISSQGSSNDGSVPSVHNPDRWSRSKKDSKDGLSFTVCKKLVQMMQGNIWMALSSQGLPQRMTLVLRFQLQPYRGRDHLPLHGQTPEQQHHAKSQFRGLQVLLADDDDVNRAVTKKQLKKLGFQVGTAASGFECLSALSHSENSFRVIILDLHMPDMDGYDVAMRIRKFRSRNWPLIIALTASEEENVLERCLQAGMNGLIRKPAVLLTMADELRRALNRAGGGV
ncbi:protein EIN4 [Punica granatum]|uniref:Ethylene receptor n=2 Tax=Punica granatum TaxID=22663 RepID=A0A218W5B6_PUNGR|nr:protein EIN4 [Punica granatum]OWM67292.1 hypothetical protein CDL15_Pgr000744 [Punica granatum]PKI32140.1 hypothetical protein CRG98_047458 [Punica granatum]